MGILLASLLVLGAVVNGSTYRIDLKGGGAYWASSKPGERAGRYVFRTTGGTLMSVRESDVSGIHRSAPAAPAPPTSALGPSSPASAARNQNVYADRLHAQRRNGSNREPSLNRQDPYFRQSPYRPGVGEAYPASPNDYTVGKTFAYPPAGRVYEDAPMNKVPEGPAVPQDSAPPPPPSHP